MMEKRFKLGQYGSHLWTREEGRKIRARLTGILEKLDVGDVLVVDSEGVDAFDFSFAEELFGKMVLAFGAQYPGRFLIVENLTECTTENLTRALESLSLMMIERRKKRLRLLGKVHPSDQETFAEVVGATGVSASGMSKKLNVNPTAMNERLAKLTDLGVVRREKGSSASGREQYVYRVLS
jgi:hypothetical protein